MSTYPKPVTLDAIVTSLKDQAAHIEDTDAVIVFHDPVDFFIRLIQPPSQHTFVLVTTTWPRTASILMRDPLEHQCQKINTETFMPKLYSVVSDDGTVGVKAEAVFPVAVGLNDDQLTTLLATALKELDMALSMIDDAFPDTILYPEHSGE